MKDSKTRSLTMTALVAALYFTLVMVFQPISYGAVQIRIAEVLALLPFFNKKFSLSLIIGCALANMFSPLGMIDMVFGLASTIICVLIISRVPNIWIAAGVITGLTGLFVGVQLSMLYGTPFWFNFVTVAAGEAVAMVAGVLLWKLLLKNVKIRQYIQPRECLYA